MIDINLLLFVISICIIFNVFMWKFYTKRKETTYIDSTDLISIYKQIDSLPKKLVMSITNSTNTYKGALGELIGYINLRASYDRIIPLGSIVDFIGIKFDKDNQEGSIDFIDIKTGKARLSKDQRDLQSLIENKKINFFKVQIDTTNAITSE